METTATTEELNALVDEATKVMGLAGWPKNAFMMGSNDDFSGGWYYYSTSYDVHAPREDVGELIRYESLPDAIQDYIERHR